MYDDEYPKELVCRCGHLAEVHLWELQEDSQGVIAKPINLSSESFIQGYAIAKCWSDLDLEGRHCHCEILAFEDFHDWANFAERMSSRVEKTINYRVKRMGVDP